MKRRGVRILFAVQKVIPINLSWDTRRSAEIVDYYILASNDSWSFLEAQGKKNWLLCSSLKSLNPWPKSSKSVGDDKEMWCCFLIRHHLWMFYTMWLIDLLIVTKSFTNTFRITYKQLIRTTFIIHYGDLCNGLFDCLPPWEELQGIWTKIHL